MSLCAPLSAGLGAAAYHRRAEARQEAIGVLARFEEDLDQARVSLNSSGVDAGLRREGEAACLAALERYDALGEGSWTDSGPARLLTSSERRHLAEAMGEAFWMLARARWLDASDAPDRESVEATVREALRLNLLAEDCYDKGAVPASLWSQRAELVGWLGDDREARRWRKRAAETPPRTARDLYLLATDLAVAGRFADALAKLETATRANPQLYWAWFLRGICHDRLGQDAEALASYQACVALRPEVARASFN
ncbi:tetratricopeptide repeat protein [Tautonia sociabilis]|uniref:Tetratricopeptide repeat protein n=1 Tax=Tautonia sociabilis TaxID=2080755 RepID=A0A432MCZ1_9BACT|nr:tetratricopeptide repeat protein [Tautonia sociabilis]RUL82323.1 tetratricopeptide repeat protein [Tautonia sociabilis]